MSSTPVYGCPTCATTAGVFGCPVHGNKSSAYRGPYRGYYPSPPLVASPLVESITDAITQAIAVLNRVHQEDPTVLPTLIEYRVPCNTAVADDPTVQVTKAKQQPGETPHDAEGKWIVGLLGIVNGLFGVQGPRDVGYICANYDDDGNLTDFSYNEIK